MTAVLERPGSAKVSVDIEATRSALEKVVLNAITSAPRSARFAGPFSPSLARLPSAIAAGWQPWVGDADALVNSLPQAIRASRDLYMTAPFARSAIQSHIVNTIGRGMRMRSVIDHEICEMTPAEALVWQNNSERYFRLYCSNPRFCDLSGRQTVYGHQRRAYRTRLICGDGFALLPFVQDPITPWSLRVQSIATERVTNPNNDLFAPNIIGGIERSAVGRIIAAHVQRRHPESSQLRMAGDQFIWDRVTMEGRTLGRPNIAWSSAADLAEMTRGRPLLETVFAAIKGIDRYTHAEAVAALVAALFTMVIKNAGATNPLSHGDGIEPDDALAMGLNAAQGEVAMGPGATVQLGPGEDVTQINPMRPNSAFDPFIQALATQVGMGTDVPKEILLKHFTSSYTAARGAYLSLFKITQMNGDEFAREFCDPIYQAFLYESVARGIISAPGFFESPLKRAAFCAALWIGPPAIQIDPEKEVKAAVVAIDNHLRSHSTAAMELWGEDWDNSVIEMAAEERVLKANGLTSPAQVKASVYQPSVTEDATISTATGDNADGGAANADGSPGDGTGDGSGNGGGDAGDA